MARGAAHVKKLVFEVPVSQPPSRMWKAWVEELPRTLVAAAPDYLERIDLIQGGKWATPGSVINVKLGKSMGIRASNSTKVKFEHGDKDKLESTWRIVEGFGLGTHWLSFSYTVKIKGGPHANSSVLIHTFEFESIGEHSLHEVHKQQVIQVTHALETFLNANPNFVSIPK